ncbi:FadR/GntR family transcriptional regulator [Deinococcus seoulensis]|uniref:FadR/GntR family transcriptional regulator n=1 Tax=Deinococcus seoulensis TaxID=1837379 RepID=UPI001664DA4A|nr:FCD domain-containing protein [Deinococcus seoulensis]
MRRIEPVPVHQLVVNEILRGISVGELAAGDALPSERQLAADLGVSRVTVREALDVLTRQGYLVKRRGNGGTCMVQPSPQLSPELRAHVQGRWQALSEVLEFRAAVEGEVAALAAARRTDHDLLALEDVQARLGGVTGSGAFRRLDSDFHGLLAAATRNEMLIDAVERARSAFFLEMDMRLPESQFQTYIARTTQAHREVLDAVRDGHGERARTLMRAHILQTARDSEDSVFGTGG